jgi:hypothetical protein
MRAILLVLAMTVACTPKDQSAYPYYSDIMPRPTESPEPPMAEFPWAILHNGHVAFYAKFEGATAPGDVVFRTRAAVRSVILCTVDGTELDRLPTTYVKR